MWAVNDILCCLQIFSVFIIFLKWRYFMTCDTQAYCRPCFSSHIKYVLRDVIVEFWLKFMHVGHLALRVHFRIVWPFAQKVCQPCYKILLFLGLSTKLPVILWSVSIYNIVLLEICKVCFKPYMTDGGSLIICMCHVFSSYVCTCVYMLYINRYIIVNLITIIIIIIIIVGTRRIVT